MLSILGLIFVIIATFYVYRTAKETGHNAVFWTVAAFLIGFGIQIGIPFIFGVVLAVVMLAQGRSMPEIQEAAQAPATIIGIICLALSVVGIWLVLRKVSYIRDDESFVPPPAPPNFDAGK